MKVITLRQLRHRWPLYLLILPALALVVTFAYFPAASAVYHSFFRWDGDEVAEYVGLKNFQDAFSDEVLGRSFYLVGILIVSNLFKMIPAILTAVVIHRLVSERWRYYYRVAFVVPMIIPGMVWLLLWKYFYNPMVGVLNELLNGSGLMAVLRWLDSGETGLPRLAAALLPTRENIVPPLFGNVWGLFIVGGLLLAVAAGEPTAVRRRTVLVLKVLVSAALGLATIGFWDGQTAWYAGAADTAGYILRGLVTVLLSKGVLVTVAAAALAIVLRRQPWGAKVLNWVGGVLLVTAAFFILTTMIWPRQTDAFRYGSPAWLGQKELLIPALIFWGFPWVGVVSVLLYLAGLGNISQDIYDAAEIDGCGWLRKFWNVELPLILTQVRLNLVLMVIATLQGWGLIFILLGDDGGPGGAGMVPGLYMFRKAFRDAEAGYAVAIGLLLFVVTLALTTVNNRYVRVEK
jgi:ABC-type sugar transport system permease subunit